MWPPHFPALDGYDSWKGLGVGNCWNGNYKSFTVNRVNILWQ